MDEAQVKKKISRLIFPAALILPCALMTANLTYDEFWSLLNFSQLEFYRILTDLSLPNNHPLNTLLLKFISAISAEPFFLRLPSLICGAFIPVLCGELAYKWSSRNRIAAMVSAALLAALSVPIAVYSGVARGYAIQLCCLLGVLWAMSFAVENPRKAAVLTAIFGIGTFLSVPTGVMFLLPAGIGYLGYSGKEGRKCREMWYAAGVVALAGILFYWVNFPALRAGQQWGNEIDSVAGFAGFLGSTAAALLLIPATAAAVAAFILQPRRLIAAFLLILPVLLALLSNGGPARCYLYLSAASAVAGGIGIAEACAKLKHREYICPAIAAVLGIAGIFCQLEKWQFVDYVAVFEKNSQELPPEILPVYRATALYPVRCGALEKSLENFNIRLSSGSFRQLACFECDEGDFNGMDSNFSEILISTGIKGMKTSYNDLPCVLYDIVPVTDVAAGNCYLLVFPAREKLSEELEKSGKILYLNRWITSNTAMILFQCGSETSDLPPDCRIYMIGEVK